MKYYKVLLNNHSCVSSKIDWTKYLPTKNDDGTWTPGKWTRANKKPLELCHNGYHVTDAMHLLDWCLETSYSRLNWEIRLFTAMIR